MPKSLVVVESPSKAKTIGKYLGKGFEVMASVGHVKDLPKSRMGVDIGKGFVPEYETIKGKNKVLQDIRKAAKGAEMVYLAPDPDREGEAIAWHIYSELKVPEDKVRRVLFNEITEKAIQLALKSPVRLNENKYNSQQARRILDRLVGYNVSPLLWDKVRRGLSAGRVQTVAVRLIVEREREIAAFKPEEYWTVEARFEGKVPPIFHARLARIGDEKAERIDKDKAEAAVATCKPGPFKVTDVKKRDKKVEPPAPFTTSRLQQEAARALRFTAKRTMGVAQRLYEGREIGERGAVGLITYMRTDSTRISDDALAMVRDHIEATYGKQYLPDKPRVFKTKGRAQDAHEAIRPTSLELTPEVVKPYLEDEEFRLYKLIWQRFVACQMAAAIYASTTVEIEGPKKHGFRSSGSIVKFDGFTQVHQETKNPEEEGEAEDDLPPIEVGQVVKLKQLEGKQHFTQPPPRFSEATLVRELEEQGIGRPSTYAAIISVIQDKKYAEKRKDLRFAPTELGVITTDLLVESFPKFFDVNFTAKMEEELDEVEEGKVEWKGLLGDFWKRLEKTLSTAKTEMRNVKREEVPTDLECPRDGGPLVIKFGKNGSFVACQNYPDCKFTSEFERQDDGTIKLASDKRLGEPCPTCGTSDKPGELVEKRGKFGRFIGCTNYPECRFTRAISTGVTCPQCKEGILQEKQSKKGKLFYGCNRFPTCDYASWDRPINKACPTCQNPYLVQKMNRNGPGKVTCPACQSTFGAEDEGAGAEA
ncbi:MAG: type I DNA topoisomerase [Deltaproteobacteria bacterium]|nr:type I DNA topoisomerase [Deltaproteobacteria bacterium]